MIKGIESRDADIICLWLKGKTMREIAQELGLTQNRVNYRLQYLKRKGDIIRKRHDRGAIHRDVSDFAETISQTNAMRARGEI